MDLSLSSLYKLLLIILISTLSLQNVGMNIYGLNFNITNITLLLFLYLSLISVNESITLINKNNKIINIVTIIYIATMFLSFVATDDIRGFLTFFTAILKFIFVGNYLHLVKREYWEAAVYFTAFIAAIFAVGHYLDYIPLMEFERTTSFGNFAIQTGYTGLIPTRGTYGILLITGLVTSCLWLIKSKILTIFGIVGITIFSFASLISLSRSTWMSFIVYFVALFVLLFITNGKKIKEKSAYYVLGCLLLVSIIAIIAPLLNEFYTNIVSLREASLTNRVISNYFAIEQGMNSPIFGIGHQITITGSIVHNAFLAVFMERGIVNFFLFSTIFAIIVFKVVKQIIYSKNDKEIFRYCSLLAGLLAIFIEMNLYRGYSANAHWLYLGLVLSCIPFKSFNTKSQILLYE